MAGKHRKEKIEHAPTKRQLSKWEKQKKQSRIITIIVAVIVVAVVGLILTGIYLEQIKPYQDIVVKVNDASFNFDYYTNMLDLLTKDIPVEQVSMYSDMAAQAIAQAELIKKKAPEIGIAPTDDEIKKRMETDGLPDNPAGTDIAYIRVIADKYTKQVCQPKQPESVQQAEIEAMFLESKAMVEDIKSKLALGDNFTQMAAEFSIEPATKAAKGYIGWIPKDYEKYVLQQLADATFKDVIFTLKPDTLSNAIYDSAITKSYGFWVLQLLEKDDAKGYHGKGILFPSQEQAEDIREQLINGGNWDELAKQYSQASGKESGADLGWIQPGEEETRLVRLLAAQEQDKISDVLRDDTAETKGGYWLIRVKDIQDRPLSSGIMQSLNQECLGAWIDGLEKEAKIENLLTDSQKELAIKKITKTRSK